MCGHDLFTPTRNTGCALLSADSVEVEIVPAAGLTTKTLVREAASGDPKASETT
jgi:hypothetical protein